MTVSTLPLPVEPFHNCPSLATASGLERGAVFNIALGYWRGKCAPLPTEDTALMLLAGYPVKTWRRVRVTVGKALAEILPSLHLAYGKARQVAEVRQRTARLGGIAAAQKRRLGASPTAGRTSLADARSHAATPAVPIRAPGYQGNGRTDLKARQAAIDSRKNDGGKVGRLSEALLSSRRSSGRS